MASKLANPCAAILPAKGAKRPFNNGKKRLTSAERDSRNVTGAGSAELSGNSHPVAFGTPRAVKDTVLSASTTEPAVAALARTRAKGPEPKIGEFRRASASKVERNRKGRRSTALRLSEVRNIMAAGVFTAQKHRALNRHTTVHFEAAGIADPVAALRAYMKLARDWLRTQGAPFAYIWVRESGERKGEHAHILMHVPAKLVAQFARRERGWRKRIGAKPAIGAFRSTAIGRSYRHAEVGIQHGEHYDDALAGIVAYLVKGAEARAVKALELSLVEPGGELWGKRSGTSENIGRAARQRGARIK